MTNETVSQTSEERDELALQMVIDEAKYTNWDEETIRAAHRMDGKAIIKNSQWVGVAHRLALRVLEQCVEAASEAQPFQKSTVSEIEAAPASKVEMSEAQPLEPNCNCWHRHAKREYPGDHLEDCPAKIEEHPPKRELCGVCCGTGRITGKSGFGWRECSECVGFGHTQVEEQREEEAQPRPDQIREQSGTVRRLDSSFYCTINGKLYVRWEYAGGPGQCKHGYARCFACPDCEKVSAPTPSDMPDDMSPEELKGIRAALQDVAEGRMRPLSEIDADFKSPNHGLMEYFPEDLPAHELVAKLSDCDTLFANLKAELLSAKSRIGELEKMLTVSEDFRRAYQDGKYKLYAMGGAICEAAADNLPMSEGPLDRATQKATGRPQIRAEVTRAEKAEAERDQLKAKVEKLERAVVIACGSGKFANPAGAAKRIIENVSLTSGDTAESKLSRILTITNTPEWFDTVCARKVREVIESK